MDFQVTSDLSSAHLQQVEDRVNTYIRQNRLVSFDVVQRDDLAGLALLRGIFVFV